MVSEGLQDRASHFGDGLFETIAIRQGQPCLWQYHLNRLQQGCERLGLPAVNETALTAEVRQHCTPYPRAVLKLILSAGNIQRGYQRPAEVIPNRYLQSQPWPDHPLYHTDTPIQLQLCQTRLGSQPLLAGIKHLNRLEQVLARNEIQPPADEGVMLDQQGRVVEGIMSNLLLRCDGCYITPGIQDCGVAGVVRQIVLERAAQQAMPIQIETVSLQTLQQAEAVYIMNSLLGVRQIAAFDAQICPRLPIPTFLQAIHQACFTPD